MACLFLDAHGNDVPTCRECGSIMVRPVGSPPGTVLTCSNCGYVAGTWLYRARRLAEYALSEVTLTRGHMGAALDEARDEGHAAGRAEALEEAADFLETTKILGDQDAANRLAAALRALAGKP